MGLNRLWGALTAPSTVRSQPPQCFYHLFHKTLFEILLPRRIVPAAGATQTTVRDPDCSNVFAALMYKVCFTFWRGNLANRHPFFPFSWGQVYGRKIDGNDRLVSRKRQLTFLGQINNCKIICENSPCISASIAITFLQVPQERHLRLL